jgi:hypothetical protein
MAQVFIYAITPTHNSSHGLINDFLEECKPLNEMEKIKLSLDPSKGIEILARRNKSLLDYACDEFGAKAVVIQGYVIFDSRKISASEIMKMNYDELENLLKEADGSFSIIKIDGNKIYVITDWIETRPLYYARISHNGINGIVVSSCLWSILKFFKEIGYPIRINDKAIVSFLWLGRIGVFDNLSLIEDVYVVPPGTILTYDLENNALIFKRYYELRYESKILDEKTAVELVYWNLLKSIRDTLNVLPEEMKKNMCVFLSGGLDSRVLTYFLASFLNRNILALTFGTVNSDDVLFAKILAKHLNIPHRVGLYDLRQLAEFAREVVRLSNGFDVVNASHVVYAMKMLNNSNCSIFTNGFALDLTLGGSYLSDTLRSIKNEKDFLLYILRKISVFSYDEIIGIIHPRLKHLVSALLNDINNLLKESKGDNYMNRNDYFFLYTRVRRFTIYGSIVARYACDEILPTINRTFLEAISRIDPKLRLNHRIYRRFLLKLKKELSLIPYQSTWIPPIFPIFMWKIGYIFKKLNSFVRKITNDRIGLKTTYFDFNYALRTKKWRELLYYTLLNRNSLIYRLGYLNYYAVKDMLIKHLRGEQQYGEKLGYILSIELFLREVSKYTSDPL